LSSPCTVDPNKEARNWKDCAVAVVVVPEDDDDAHREDDRIPMGVRDPGVP
jgi:hypothetical protein